MKFYSTFIVILVFGFTSAFANDSAYLVQLESVSLKFSNKLDVVGKTFIYQNGQQVSVPDEIIVEYGNNQVFLIYLNTLGSDLFNRILSENPGLDDAQLRQEFASEAYELATTAGYRGQESNEKAELSSGILSEIWNLQDSLNDQYSSQIIEVRKSRIQTIDLMSDSSPSIVRFYFSDNFKGPSSFEMECTFSSRNAKKISSIEKILPESVSFENYHLKKLANILD